MSQEPEVAKCIQCGNPLNESELNNNQIMCDRCWEVREQYLGMMYDEYEEEEEEVYTCEFCGGEYGDGWATCICYDEAGFNAEELIA